MNNILAANRMEEVLELPIQNEISKKLTVDIDVRGYINQVPAIKNKEQQEKLANDLALIKGAIKRIDSERKEITDPIKKGIDLLMEKANKILNPLKSAETNIKSALTNWETAERNRIAKENAKLQAEADEKARKEIAKLASKAEKAEANGNVEKAENLRQQSQSVQSMPIPVVQQQKTSGLSFKDSWEIEIIDADLVPRNYCMPNETKIKEVVNCMAGKMNIPGVKITHKLIPASKSK